MIQHAPIPLYVYAKAPIAGKVKTRLQSHCSAAQAALIAEILLVETVRRCHVGWPGELVLSVGNEPEHPFVKALAQQYNIKVVGQVDGDLGMKMLNTFESAASPAAIIGADASLVSTDVLQQTYAALHNKQNVIGPSEDGGYYVIGLAQPEPMLFSGVDWGTEKVLRQTLDIALHHSIELLHLPTLMDIDEWADVERAAEYLPELTQFLKSQRD